jgi:beta-1,4-N-acetylglucosaminyltransferase
MLEGASWLPQAVGLFVAVLCIRLSMCLPAYKSRRRKQHVKGLTRIHTLLVFGSGGHTTEMLMLVEKLDREKFGPVDCVLAQSDQTTMAKVSSSVSSSMHRGSLHGLQDCTWHTVWRSREVRQGWASTLLTSLYALLQVRPLNPLLLCHI